MDIDNFKKFQIEYIVLSDNSTSEFLYSPPKIFENSDILKVLKYLPKDIFQVFNSIEYYEIFIRSSLEIGYDLKVINISDIDFLKKYFFNNDRIRLFFLDGANDRHKDVYLQLISLKYDFNFIYFYGKDQLEDNIKVVKSPTDFLFKLIEVGDILKEKIGLKQKNINLSVGVHYKELIFKNHFIPCFGNEAVINGIIGNFLDYNSSIEGKEENEKIAVNAIKNGNSFERQELFIKQIKFIDAHFDISYNHRILKKVISIDPTYSPLILIAPFKNPDFKTGEKDIQNIISLEQTSNYTINSNANVFNLHIFGGLKFDAIRLGYLDDLAFLHSSFSYSPIIRLPLKGKSIYLELSFFSPKNFFNYEKLATRKKLRRSINKFGEKLKNAILGDKLESIISKRNSQIVTISDLPIEWMNLKGVPISFTHDICRIPEIPLGG